MSQFMTLLKREWLEARLPFFWLPLGILGFILILSLMLLVSSAFGEIEIVTSSDQPFSNLMFIDQWSDAEVEERMRLFRVLVTTPFYLVYLISALFVLLGALYDDRKDRSVLFWKSLPVSDLQTVASKLVLPVWIAPLVMIACAVLAQIVLLVVLSAFLWLTELGDAARLWWHSGLISGTFSLVLGFLIQGLWVLPVIGYLLLISATVPRLTLLWAVLLPIVPAVLEGIFFNTDRLTRFIERHIEPAALPNFVGDDERIMPVLTSVGEQLALLLNLDLWLGVLIGALLLYGAVLMRGMKNEL